MNSFKLPCTFSIGVLGAGQLAKMLNTQVRQLGLCSRFYAQSEDDPACDDGPSFLGQLNEEDKLVEFARECDVITLENEFISSKILKAVQAKSGTPIYPSPEAFAKIETKPAQKELMQKLDVPVAPWARVNSWEECLAFFKEHNDQAILKASFGGYDGYGNCFLGIDDRDRFEDFIAKNKDVYLEAIVPMKKEWAVMIGCFDDKVVSYPACETVQKDYKCDYVLFERNGHEEIRKKLKEYAERIGKELNTRGIFAFEFFETEDGSLYFNESAPRPHNSHHYTQDAANIDQFALLVRSLIGMKAPQLEVRHDAVMGNLIGKEGGLLELPELPTSAHVHLYGKKECRPGRKMGHINFVGDDSKKLIDQWKKIQETYKW